MSDGHVVGTLPVNFSLAPGMFLIFAGRRWRVTAVDPQHKVVDLVPAPGGRPPVFIGTGTAVDDHVRKEMLKGIKAGSSDLPRCSELPSSSPRPDRTFRASDSMSAVFLLTARTRTYFCGPEPG